MEFLKEVGISENTIMVLNESSLPEEKMVASSYSQKIFSSIKYLRDIGVTNETIENILILDFHYLIPGEEKIKIAVEQNDVNEFVTNINNDIDYVSYLKDF